VDYSDVYIMTESEKQIENLLNGEGLVLGETTTSAELMTLIDEKKDTENKEEETKISVWKDNKKEIIVSQALVKAWNRENESVIGEELELQYLLTSTVLPQIKGRVLSEPEKYKIVGVFAETKTPLVMVPVADMESMGIKEYTMGKVMVKKETDLAKVRTLVQAMGLVTKSVVDTLNQIAKLFTIVRFLLGSFGAIALVVALAGMFNTLTVSLLERTREIGVMKSLGTTNIDITRILLAESVLISLSGGLFGLGAGFVLGKILDQVIFGQTNLNQSMFVLNWWFSIMVILISWLVGVITGWYPAKRASRISALNALKYE